MEGPIKGETQNFKKISHSSKVVRQNLRNHPVSGPGRRLSANWKKNNLSIDVTAPDLLQDSDILKQTSYFGLIADLIRKYSKKI